MSALRVRHCYVRHLPGFRACRWGLSPTCFPLRTRYVFENVQRSPITMMRSAALFLLVTAVTWQCVSAAALPAVSEKRSFQATGNEGCGEGNFCEDSFLDSGRAIVDFKQTIDEMHTDSHGASYLLKSSHVVAEIDGPDLAFHIYKLGEDKAGRGKGGYGEGDFGGGNGADGERQAGAHVSQYSRTQRCIF